MLSIVCFGEVLWDVFDTHKKIGGAPLNVALRLNAFGNKTAIISAVGNDPEGEELLSYLKEHRLNTTHIRIHKEFKTGMVNVSLNNAGVASYTIEHPAAWDNIEGTPANKALVKQADALVYGSLASRDAVSKQTLIDLIGVANFKIFDINLRAPHYNYKDLQFLMDQADMIKFNEEELTELCASLGKSYPSLTDQLNFISEKTNTHTICITLGEKGAVLLNHGMLYTNTGYTVKVLDTVGAGDAFLGTFIHYLLSENNPQKALDYACAAGALVASKAGANPKIEEKDILDLVG
ncbi:carbohydrate kinase [Seonamhaeicola sp.]|uniref:carbohydrate kinase family protein n=1 Tax=Seonamhaeicola sp. TaxID=1912245 RepID=UPI00262B7F03|nr:carbohydrate kinase [Seonamhaeicola sp.]